ncbi:MAG TPA: nucleotidyl transferase AbiEii/AbiGii toxin family protein [Rhodocyclaceae bacterium]|nr:nucleotidyl transferase AbiEii/AbiGii toxin family protein [Rhodocyclaceae bacterium]
MFYLDLFRALNDHQVRYLVVGGLAMNLHGVPRMTMDVDLVLAMDEENLDRFIACAEQMKLAPVAPVKLVDLKDPQQRKQWAEEKHMVAFGLQAPAAGAPLLDILIAPAIDLAAGFQRKVVRTVGDIAVDVAAIEDLIALKQAAHRRQDLDDIEHLERLRDY